MNEIKENIYFENMSENIESIDASLNSPDHLPTIYCRDPSLPITIDNGKQLSRKHYNYGLKS